MKKLLLTFPIIIALGACGAAEQTAEKAAAKTADAVAAAGETTANTAKKVVDYVAPDSLPGKLADADAGTYAIDKGHAFLTASVSHGGLSDYRMDFIDFDSTMNFDPNDASKTSIEFSVNPASVTTNYPGDYKAGHAKSGFDTWDEHLGLSDKFFNAGKFPKATFKSTKVKRTGDYTAKVTGDLTFLGVSRPVTFDVTYNGVANKPWFGERDLIGFNAEATIDRFDFGLNALKGGIGEQVSISFSGEYLQAE